MPHKTLLPARPAAIIFDFDGVILDSAEIKAQAFAEIYSGHGEEWAAFILDYQRMHGGVSRREKFKHFDKTILGQEPTEERLSFLSQRFTDIVFKKVLSAPFIPGAKSLLDAARDHSRLFVVSGTPQEELVEIVRQRALDSYFEIVIGAPTKKHEAFTRILALGLARETVVAVGDSITECSAAIELGIPFLGIRNGPSPTNFPEEVLPLPDLTDATRLLGF
ncbi:MULTISPECIES: HAD hydrolase-like protein [unclassified Mesorhizobium]|uniref:HAD family hydrolase n=1 Tax=unclassified Mesorhizobium TaxID=325217 RepID=UPI000FDB7DC1|nr:MULTISPECIES: HAD hydrolase-like protein [unclassified Mesorhizobium]TGR43657.1 HAD family hydrolase [bacterium M00.F.Ca.ET.199.01.1.1]TGU40268.1 HAD family hydrolase [bacterium M00.F.Ca.ET.156.01.1.1]TGV86809.1 HAD family hydrolase [Mesorhizobium sp. M00.F.Ca.ET.149.01.1.1]TGR27989.1 HAD family hydrolase [Mesorhizobium sp. M8A.F.Ca.ET.197.01.1.1]TGR32391.1 HAD family hydrolase [Mesorhizobium sp. M8A.F.Ca.ET.202.01.1.1]